MNKFLFFLISISLGLGLAFSLPVASLATQTYSAPTNGLVGYWSFDEGVGNIARDYSGNKNNGTLSGATKPVWTSGYASKGLSFNGSSAYVNMGNIFNLTGSMTFSAWVKLNTTTGGQTIMCKAEGGSYCVEFNIPVAGKISWNPFIGGSYRTVSANSPAVINTWYHVVGVYDGSAVKLYINGQLQTSTVTVSGNVSTTSEPFIIGANPNGGGTVISQFLNGMIDEARVYNRALSATEISNLYKVGAQKLNSQPTLKPLTLDSGLVGYWTMDNQDINWSTSKITDKSGSGNTGTITGLDKSTSTVSGKLGQSLIFNGNNYIVGGTSPFDFPDQTFAVSFWGKTTGIAEQFALSEGASVGGWGVGTGVACGNGCARIFYKNAGNSNAFEYQTSKRINDGKWHHFVGIMQTNTTNSAGNNGSIYIDGVYYPPSAAFGGSYAYGSSSKKWSIGARDEGATLRWNGSLDDIRVYNRGLSAGEIKQLYNQGAGTKVNTSPVLKPLGLDSGLVGYWTMDNKDINWCTGTTTDRSGNGNTGTLVSLSTTSSPVAGKIGQALRFNGTSSYILNGKIINTTKSTVSAWVYLTAYPTAGKLATIGGFIQGNGGNTWDKVLFVSPEGRPYFYTWTGSMRCTSQPSVSIPLKSWHLLTGTNDGANNIMYLDGVSIGSIVAGDSYAGYGAPNVMAGGVCSVAHAVCGGVTYDQTYLAANSRLDDFRVYNRALSPAEVLQLYRQGK